jgi:hypothetical protein
VWVINGEGRSMSGACDLMNAAIVSGSDVTTPSRTIFPVRSTGLVGHMGELRSVSPVVGYLMHNDQLMVGSTAI